MGKILQNNRKTFIYTMSDPFTGEVRYIGKTAVSLAVRLSGHICDSKKLTNHRHYWIRSILNKGGIPILEVIDEVEWQHSQDTEIYWIEQFKHWGFNLVNTSTGGEGGLGVVPTKEHRKRMSETMKEKSKTVYQYSLDGNFIESHNSNVDAAEKVNGRNQNISQTCLLGKKSHKGFIWSYLPPNKIDFSKYKHKKGNGNYSENNSFKLKRRKVVVTTINTKKERIFNSIKEASDFSNICKPGICKECQGKSKTKGKYKFRYYE